MPGIFLKIIPFIIVVVLTSLTPVNISFSPTKEGFPVYISSNGVHTDIILPIKSEIIDWQEVFDAEHFGNGWKYATHIAFGWGDKGFYLNTPEWSDLKINTALNALFIPSASVMHVTLWPNPEKNDLTKDIMLSEIEYEKIVDYILSSFTIGPNRDVLKIDHPGYGDYDLFFQSSLKFHLFRTCNVWTNTGLKKAGVRASFWTPFDKPILYHLSKIDGQ